MYVNNYVVRVVRYSMTIIKGQSKGSAQKEKNNEREENDLPNDEEVVVEEEEEEEEEVQYEENRLVTKRDGGTKVSDFILMCSNNDVNDHKQDAKKTEDKKAVVSGRLTRNNKVHMLNYTE
jgi:hypothetical protein